MFGVMNPVSFLVFWPLVLALGLLGLPARWVRGAALGGSFLSLAVAGWVLARFDVGASAALQSVTVAPWLPLIGAQYHVGVDGLSVALLALTNLLTPLCVLSAWNVKERVGGFMAALNALAGLVNGVFVAQDFVLFYVFFEASLIPMYLLIGMWGGENRVYAALKFFLYTFVGSVLMLVAGLWLWAHTGSFELAAWHGLHLPPQVGRLLFLAFFAAFAVKIPMWPVHTWLPDAHVQAPTAGSVMLAGILLKMGGYGLLRFNMGMFPDAAAWAAPAVFGLSAVAVVYAALVAYAQTDIKKLIAYSSVSHMGLVTLGIFALNPLALHGAMLVMLNHGIVSAGLFLAVGVVYERLHTRELANFGGLVNVMPRFAFVLMILTLAAVALPLTNSFVGEFMALAGAWEAVRWATVVAVTGVIFGALYMLRLYRGMMYGAVSDFVAKHRAECPDIGWREGVMFAPLVVLIVLLGIQPNLAMRTWDGWVTQLVTPVVSAPAAVDTPAAPTHAEAVGDAVKQLVDTQRLGAMVDTSSVLPEGSVKEDK